MDKVVNEILVFGSDYFDFDNDCGVNWYVCISKIFESGVMGDVIKVIFEKGQEIWDVMVKNLVFFVNFIKSKLFEDLYQKKY